MEDDGLIRLGSSTTAARWHDAGPRNQTAPWCSKRLGEGYGLFIVTYSLRILSAWNPSFHERLTIFNLYTFTVFHISSVFTTQRTPAEQKMTATAECWPPPTPPTPQRRRSCCPWCLVASQVHTIQHSSLHARAHNTCMHVNSMYI